MTEKVKPARLRIGCTSTEIRPQRFANRDPNPHLPFEHELETPPNVLQVIAFISCVGGIYFLLGMLAQRYLGWMP